MENAARFQIPKGKLWMAYRQARKTKVVGVDGQTIHGFSRNRSQRLHQQWVQLTTGRYMPSPVRRIYIPKRKGGWRPIGIPTVKDFIVQTVLKNELSSRLEGLFHPNSYGHKQNRDARIQAIRTAARRCLQYDWVLVLDISKFGDSIDHQLLLNRLSRHVRQRWVLLYTRRTMKAPIRTKDGALVRSHKGLAQGNKLNFLLGNFYLHHIFDVWMKANHPAVPFERYTDDIICHCKSEAEAKRLLSQIRQRLGAYKLTAHPSKTKIVYCRDAKRNGAYANTSFDYLGATFAARRNRTKSGASAMRFAPAAI